MMQLVRPLLPAVVKRTPEAPPLISNWHEVLRLRDRALRADHFAQDDSFVAALGELALAMLFRVMASRHL